ncbi:TIGR03862 family flavoprotein [bacterium]|nr:TIGR03862 family flavoprotein [bacterium]
MLQPIAGRTVAVIGGGPSGLMAAELLAGAGAEVDVYESMPTVGRKFLRAGLGGLNITHSEPYGAFCSRYGDRRSHLQSVLDLFPPDALCAWVHDLGIETFVGSSGRVFPKEMKAAPLLRAWIHRVRSAGVRINTRHSLVGINSDSSITLKNADAEFSTRPDAVILALGGASWPQLGSTGSWAPWLEEKGVEFVPFESANCGFEVVWSDHLKEKFAGTPLKAVSLTFTDLDGVTESREGELLISEYGVEGSLIYAYSKRIREYLKVHGKATVYIDLLPGRSVDRVLQDLSRPREKRSLSRHLQGCFGKDALKRTLLFELLTREQMEAPGTLASLVKAMPITIDATRPIAEAISSAGGVKFESIDDNFMLKAMPGVFVAGEMLDWEAPTGGYLLTACFATGVAAAIGASRWLWELD